MRGAFETEVKLVATPAMLRALREHGDLAGPEQTGLLLNTYFDTAEGSLGAAGATLRIRENAGERQQTLKLDTERGSAVRRREWSAKLTGDAPDPSLFPAAARAALHRLLDGAEVQAVATSRIKRTTRRLRLRKSEIELAIDSGKITAGGRSEAINEIELELSRGSLADLLGLAARLPLGPELYWSLTSKAKRCHVLAMARPPAPVLAKPVQFARESSTARGFQAIAWECLGQLLGNYRLVVANADPRAVHQARVAIRRLRAACSLFGDVIEDDAAPVLRAELKAVAADLGQLRDLDVLTERIAGSAKATGQDATALIAQLEARRAGLAGSVQAMLSGAPFQALLFGLASWIEGGVWRVQFKDTAGLPVRTFAARELARRTRKLRGKHERLSEMTDAERHSLRIKVKKLRYAAEFFSGLFPDEAAGRDRRRYAKALSRLQESLGELNDFSVAAAGTGQLFADIDPIAAAGFEAQLSQLLKSDSKEIGRLLKRSEKSLSRVEETPAWWKTGQVAKP